MAKMGFTKEQLTKKLTPGGIYDVHLAGFKPSKSKSNPDNINLNPILKIVNNKDFTGVPVFFSLPQSQGWLMQDFVHGFGLQMDADGNMPGDWEFPDPNKPETWRYRGPLVGKIAKFELVESDYQGKPQLKVNQIICSVPDCKTKNPDIQHSTKMAK